MVAGRFQTFASGKFQKPVNSEILIQKFGDVKMFLLKLVRKVVTSF